MPGYASGGYIPAPPEGDDRVPAFLSSGSSYLPLAASMPVHLDDDECVVHQDQDGWHCTRVLHQGYPCQSPTPTQNQADGSAQGGDTTTTGAGGQGQAGQTSSTPHPPLPHPAAPPHGTPAHGQGVGAGQATGNPTQPQPARDPAA